MECMEIFPRWKKGVFLTRGHSPLTIRPMIAKQLTPELGEKKNKPSQSDFPRPMAAGPNEDQLNHSPQCAEFTVYIDQFSLCSIGYPFRTG